MHAGLQHFMLKTWIIIIYYLGPKQLKITTTTGKWHKHKMVMMALYLCFLEWAVIVRKHIQVTEVHRAWRQLLAWYYWRFFWTPKRPFWGNSSGQCLFQSHLRSGNLFPEQTPQLWNEALGDFWFEISIWYFWVTLID